jgi:hypothetical protein
MERSQKMPFVSEEFTKSTLNIDHIAKVPFLNPNYQATKKREAYAKIGLAPRFVPDKNQLMK